MDERTALVTKVAHCDRIFDKMRCCCRVAEAERLDESSLCDARGNRRDGRGMEEGRLTCFRGGG